MSYQATKFQLALTPKVIKQLEQLPLPLQKQYDKAFQIIRAEGPSYRSLRTHRYRQKSGFLWGSSASMALRFYWDYGEEGTILVIAINSH